MYKVACSCILLIALVSLAGCGESPDSLVKQQISNMSKFADAVESNAEKSELETLAKRIEETGKKIKELSESQIKAVMEKHGKEWIEATVKYMAATMKMGMKQMGGPGAMQMPKMPEGMPKMPEGMPKMPEGMPKMPEGMPKMPGTN